MNYPKNATLLSLVSLILALVYLDPDKSEFGKMFDEIIDIYDLIHLADLLVG